MTAAQKLDKLVELNQVMADAAQNRQLSDIPLTDSFWNICATARRDIASLEATVTQEVNKEEKSLADKMKDLLAGGNQ